MNDETFLKKSGLEDLSSYLGDQSDSNVDKLFEIYAHKILDCSLENTKEKYDVASHVEQYLTRFYNGHVNNNNFLSFAKELKQLNDGKDIKYDCVGDFSESDDLEFKPGKTRQKLNRTRKSKPKKPYTITTIKVREKGLPSGWNSEIDLLSNVPYYWHDSDPSNTTWEHPTNKSPRKSPGSPGKKLTGSPRKSPGSPREKLTGSPKKSPVKAIQNKSPTNNNDLAEQLKSKRSTLKNVKQNLPPASSLLLEQIKKPHILKPSVVVANMPPDRDLLLGDIKNKGHTNLRRKSLRKTNPKPVQPGNVVLNALYKNDVLEKAAKAALNVKPDVSVEKEWSADSSSEPEVKPTIVTGPIEPIINKPKIAPKPSAATLKNYKFRTAA